MSGEKLGSWALILGIVSAALALFSFAGFIPFVGICTCLTTPLGAIVALTAIILGIVSLVQGAGDKKVSAIIGIVLGFLYWIIVGVSTVISIIIGAGFSAISDAIMLVI